MNRTAVAAAGAAILAAVVFAAINWQGKLERGLPPRELCADQAAARIRAFAFADEHGGSVVPVLGTGSMAPYIPPAPAGRDPKSTIVAYVVSAPGARYEDIGKLGWLVIYRADWATDGNTMHLAVSEDSGGWIMTGLHNEGFENKWRVRRDNVVAIAAATFTW